MKGSETGLGTRDQGEIFWDKETLKYQSVVQMCLSSPKSAIMNVNVFPLILLHHLPHLSSEFLSALPFYSPKIPLRDQNVKQPEGKIWNSWTQL